MAATLDLRSTAGTLRLAPNGGNATVRSFVVIGAKGDPGVPGLPGPTSVPADTAVAGFVTNPSLTLTALAAKFAARLEPASYTYNTDGTVATETVGGKTTTYAWNPDGSLNTATRDGVTLTYTYDATTGNLTGVA